MAQDIIDAEFLYPPEPEPGDVAADGSYTERFEGKVKSFLETRVIYTHPNRIRRYEMSRLSDYYRMSQQWKRKLRTGRSNLTRYRDLSWDPNDPRSIPTPTLNIVEDKIRNEAARLSQPDYQPYVPVSGVNPDVDTREGAKLAVQALEHCLRETKWADQLCMGTNHMPQYGGWWLKSYWDKTFEEATTVAAPEAVRCPSCEFTLASPAVSDRQARSLELPIGTKSVDSCPFCQEPPQPMLPFTPVGEELQQQDPLGRPMGQDVPVGCWRCETRSDYDMWVEHDGIEVLPGQWDEIAEVRVVNIEWLRNRYAAAFDVEPENEGALRKWHPIALDYGFGYMSPHTPDRRVRLWEFYKRPWRTRTKDPITGVWTAKMNKGRLIAYANGKVLDYSDLTEEGTDGQFYPKVKYVYMAHELRSGGKELHGVSQFEGLVKAQDSVNRMMSMIEDTLYRMGVPSFLVTKAMSFVWEASGRAGRRVVFEPDDRYPGMKPEPVGETQINPALFQVIDRYLQYSEDITASREQEEGGGDKGEAASSIQLKLENAGAQRAQRHMRIREGLQEAYGHGLTLLSNKVKEPRTLWREDNSGQYQQRVWEGKDLHGQTRVQIDSNPVYDSDLVQMINLKTAQDMGTIQPTNPRTAKLINRRLHIPTELLVSENMQSDLAEREYKDLIERQIPPFIDAQQDDDAAHLDQHAQDIESEPWRDMEEQVGIGQILGLLEDWDKPRAWTAPGMEQPGQPMAPPSQGPPPWMLQTPPTPPNPMTGDPGSPGGAIPLMDEELKKGNPGNPMTGQPAQPPMPALQDRIYAYWGMLLSAAGIQPPQQGQPLWMVLQMRSHKEGHRLRLEAKAMQTMAGAPLAAPAGAPETFSGTSPGPQGGGMQMNPESLQ